MIATIQPSGISGIIQAPPSKSAMQRACAAALIRNGKTILLNAGNSEDERTAVAILENLGCTCSFEGSTLVIDSTSSIIFSRATNNHANLSIDCGESGLALRMFTPIVATSEHETTITGRGSLLQRPVNFFDEVLPALNVQVKTNGGKLPVTVRGPLQPKDIVIDGALSSQFLTGLLMAYSSLGAGDVTITVKDLKSRPYIDLTLQVLNDFGLKTPLNRDYSSFYFDNRTIKQAPPGFEYVIEGDWSGASFLLVAGAIAGDVKVTGIRNTSRQADKKIVDALLDAGAAVVVGDDQVKVRRNLLTAFRFDATDCPDLFPPLVALAANCKGVSRIRGLKRLKYKESDRGLTLQEEFNKLGTEIQLNDDEMLVFGNGQVTVKNHTLNSHHDHRIAMACAVAGLNADFGVEIRNADAVKKSYPDFWDHLKQLNADLSLKP